MTKSGIKVRPDGKNEEALDGEVFKTESVWRKKYRICSLIGSLERSALLNKVNWVTETRDLMEIQQLFHSKDATAMEIAPNFKDFCRLIVRNYKTVMERIGFLFKYEMETCQELESAGFTIKDLRLFGKLSKDQQESVQLLISNGQVDESTKEAVRNMAAENIQLRDRLDEAQLKTKAELIEERDQEKKYHRDAENLLTLEQRKIDKMNDRIQRMMADANPQNQIKAIRMLNKQISKFRNVIEQASETANTDSEFKAELSTLKILIMEASEFLK